MENNNNYNRDKQSFDAFVDAVGLEIEQAQVRLITVANAQMLFHYWKIGSYILYQQKLHGWGSKIIKQLAQKIRFNYPEKKGYSERNLSYMCQFARSYPVTILQGFTEASSIEDLPNIQNIIEQINKFNREPIMQEVPAQIKSVDSSCSEIMQEAPAQIKSVDSSCSEIMQEVPAQIKSVDSSCSEVMQEAPAQIKSVDSSCSEVMQEAPAQFMNLEKTIAFIYQKTVEEIESLFLASPIAKVNWASHMVLLTNSLPLGIKFWYMLQAIALGWSSNVLKMQIDTNLYERQIKINKINNFTNTLPSPQSDLANYLLKDPYIFDMVSLKEKADERDIENQLIDHVSRYLLEMGNGFAFVAKQKHFQIGNSDFYTDLILYNIKLHSYVVVELKATPFKPEYAGQLNFYINIIDNKLKGENDNKTIGLLLCRGKDEVVAQYALAGYDQPIGVSDYQLSKAVPQNLKSTLPSIEEVEEELALFLRKGKNS